MMNFQNEIQNNSWKTFFIFCFQTQFNNFKISLQNFVAIDHRLLCLDLTAIFH